MVELIALLDKLQETPGEEVAQILIQHYNHQDYLVKSKAFAMSCLLPHPVMVPALAEFLQAEEEEEFRLRAIEVLQKIGSSEALNELVKLLTDRNPLVVRGTIIALGGVKSPEAVKAMLEFAASPQGRIVRRELVGEAVSFALEDITEPEQLLKDLGGANPSIRRYLRDLNLKRPPKPNFTVYPSNDYFTLQAKARGIDYKRYRKLVKS